MSGWYLAIAVALLIANGFFVGAEFALLASRRTKLETMATEGSAGARNAVKSLSELTFMLAGVQLGITMASLGLGFVGEPAVAHLLEGLIERFIELPSGVLHTLSLVIALTIVIFFHMVIGEMAPKNMAIADPERAAIWVSVPLRLYANMFRPFINLLNGFANWIVQRFGVDTPDERLSVHTVEEIGAMVQESARGGVIDQFEERLLSGAVELGERDAGAAMVPRTELSAMPSTATPEEIELRVVESGHSRIPIYRDSLDDIAGFFHAKDLLQIPREMRDRPLPAGLIRQMLVIPESRKLRPLLLEMRRQRIHAALVLDEHGGTAGIVTLEDLIEELVGEIRDEHDVTELGIQRLGGDRWVVPGGLRIDEAESRLGVVLPEGEYETIAGFLMDQLGRIPKRRDVVEHESWRLVVRSMHRRRVVQVMIEPSNQPTGSLPE